MTTKREVRLGRLFRRRKILGYVDEPMLSVFRDHGVVLKDSLTNYNQTAADRSIYQLVEPGWLAVNRMKAWQGSLGISSLRGILSGHYICFEPSHGESDRFLHYLLRSQSMTAHMSSISRGVRPGQIEIDNDELAATPLVLPTVEEQRRIADFLDDRVARIDHIIAARRQQMGLLKSSGKDRVSGLFQKSSQGSLHGPLRRFARSLDRVRIPLSSEERATRQGRYPYYGASGVIDHLDEFLFDGPKVLLSEDGANLLLRSTPIAFVARGQYWVNNHAHILDPFDGIHEFWAARIESLDVSSWVTGSAQPKLTIEAALNLPVSAPRDHNERRDVADRVLDIRQSVAGGLKDLVASVALLSEYKHSLISSAVTGGLDVTTAGNGVPG